MRLYVPATLDRLRTWYDARAIPAEAERFVAAEESEESEYDALMAAAEESAGLLSGDSGRRVVLVAEAAEEDDAIAWRQLVAVHADPEPVAIARPEDLDEPAWYAVQEVPALLAP